MSSLKNFIPSEVMSALIVTKMRKQLVAADVVSTDYRGVLGAFGDSIKIPTFTTSGATDYTRNSTLTYSAVDGAGQILKIDQQKYFAYGIDFLDERQSPANIANAVLEQATMDLSEAADTHLIQTIWSDGAGITGGSGASALGTTSVPISVVASDDSGSGILNFVGRIQRRLDEANAPQNDRYLVCPPWFHSYLVQNKCLEVSTNVNGSEAYDNGRVGRVLGFDVRVSTNLTNYNDSGSHVYAGVKSACQFVDSLVEAKIAELETKFALGARGLYVYGAKVVNANGIAKAIVTAA